jgi:hypothetical protein
VLKQLFGGKMLRARDRGVEDRQSLLGDAQSLQNEESFEFFARGRNAHASLFSPKGAAVNRSRSTVWFGFAGTRLMLLEEIISLNLPHGFAQCCWPSSRTLIYCLAAVIFPPFGFLCLLANWRVGLDFDSNNSKLILLRLCWVTYRFATIGTP